MKLFANKNINRGVWLLSLASLFTDIAGESAYSILPLFLTGVLHAGAASLGVIEGVAETTASLVKLWSGAAADRMGKSKPLVLGGYLLANGLKPLIGFATVWEHVLGLRFLDRTGKGIRSAPRDAWLARLGPAETAGRRFAFHRGMDHMGAILGPLLASAYLWLHPGGYRALLFWTLLPGMLACLLISRTEETPYKAVPAKSPQKWVRWSEMPLSLRQFFMVLLVFSLGNSSDAFLLLRFKDAGFPPATIPLLWAGLHVVKMTASFASGALSEKMGLKPTILLGWIIYGLVYLGFAFVENQMLLVLLLIIYGLYFGFTEAPEKTLIAQLSPPETLGTGFGFYAMTVGISALPASLLFGALWETFGRSAAFTFGAALALVAALGFICLVSPVATTPAKAGAAT